MDERRTGGQKSGRQADCIQQGGNGTAGGQRNGVAGGGGGGQREKAIVRASVVGIAGNVLLAGFKAAVGLLSHSIAITLDAVNNVSDALSSVITIVGTKLAAKPADKKHPFGYGRLEYLSALVIAVIILYAGVTSLAESVKKILSPQEPQYGLASLVILGVAVATKIAMGLYARGTGRAVNSDSLVASGNDALMDSVISASTVVAAVVYLATGFSMEAYLGAVISVLILRAGFETLRDTISEILGERAAESLARDIKATVAAVEGVRGVYDLVLNNYGPDSFIASLHIEVDDDTTVVQIDAMQQKITQAVYARHGVAVAAVGVYPANTGSSKAADAKRAVMAHLASYPQVLQMHGLYLNEEERRLKMDIIIDFDAPDRIALYQKIRDELRALFPQYTVFVQLDADLSA